MASEVEQAAAIVGMIRDLAESWEFRLGTWLTEAKRISWTVEVTDRKTGETFTYQGRDLGNTVRRAWAGEPPDR